ncbi:hypothetical protein [Methylobacterium sp. E-046]|uniref:hypothetical protein n=1 Tax=Methylobacterium sp. E-046 TaxID=2836576 RepID=UPI001FB9E830|nr:hypothetical protein [Methylobacterium sp. E-046]MCJ2097681.1 hypothetical protein [Methylobacterium sp. E-046]
MSIDSASVLAALAIVAVMVFSLTAAAERSRRHASRERQLRRATIELGELSSALDELDDEATPAVMLVYALRLSDAFTNPAFAAFVRDQLAQAPGAFDDKFDEAKPAEEDSELADALQATLRTRPDLVVAFVRAFSAAISAFAERWPECTPYVEPLRRQILAHPAAEARRVVTLSNRQVAGAAPGLAVAA